MKRRRGRLLSIVFTASLLALAGLAAPALAESSSAHTSAQPGFRHHFGSRGEVDVNVCSTAVAVGYAHCHARERLAPAAPNASGAEPSDVIGNQGAYDPQYLQSAYNAPATHGAGQTVAIVDAFDAPTAEADLAEYRSHFGLPACTTANGCFKKVDQSGGTNYPIFNSSWAQEIALDIDMVSALCPNCNILLVEATNASFVNLGAAVNRAVILGADVVSNSYGGAEFSNESSADAAFFDHPGVAMVASTGDSGYEVNYPASSPSVLAVGGTSLFQTTHAGTRDATETVWSGAGSGCSDFEPKPAWQTDSGCANRSVADVSAVVDPATGVWVYSDGNWLVFGGTSAASPIIGAMYALAENDASTDNLASYPYAHPAELNDVVSGNNGSCGGSYLCTGAVGYDGPTGLGTPNGVGAFRPGPTDPNTPTPDFSVSAAPVLTPMRVGDVAKRAVTVTPLHSFSGDVHFSAVVTPSLGLSKSFGPNATTVGAQAGSSTLTYVAHKAGSYTVTIKATHGGMTRTQVRRVYVNDFAIKATPGAVAVTRGNGVHVTITITPAGSFNKPVTLSVSGLSSRDRVVYVHNPAAFHGSQTITIKTSKLDAKGTRTLHIKGTAGPLNHIALVKLTFK